MQTTAIISVASVVVSHGDNIANVAVAFLLVIALSYKVTHVYSESIFR